MTSPSDLTSDFARFGAALDGQYALECEIGRGGMGIVYLARDLRLDRRVAIKTLPPHLANDSVVRERFLREARTAARLSHQNIVPIHRADEIGGHVFFVMGYVDGDSMAQRVRDRGALDPRAVVRELRDVADALAYAHQNGVVHRDVKAENILVDRVTGRAMVTDFGIARLAEAAPLTVTGQVLGTVYYLSPEQVSGGKVDGRSDIYALGVAGFFALSGRFPFDAELASAVLIAHVNSAPPPLQTVAPQAPRALADVIDRRLRKDPAGRFQNCDALAERLAGIVAEVDRETDRRIARGEPITKAPLLSDTEAQAILGRAASLQAVTGIESQPPLAPRRRDAARDAARDTGHRVANVRDAALEAGIASKYVDRAIAEHGLAKSVAPLPVAPIDCSPPANAFVGAPTRVDFEVSVDGEMPDSDLDLLVDILREATGDAGIVTTVGRSFSWHMDPAKGNIQVSVLPRGGKTRIRISEPLRLAAVGVFATVIGTFGIGALPVWLGIGLKMHNFGAGVLAWTGTAALSYFASRALFAYHNRTRTKLLEPLIERLAAQTRASIDQSSSDDA